MSGMANFQTNGADIHYDEYGEGFPVLLIAPGGMKSEVSFWHSTPWHPIEQLRGAFRVIAMDQRNAGRSTGPIDASDGWHTYAQDQIALLDHLGVDRFAVAGMCIGGPYAMGLIAEVPERVSAAVLFQTIGLTSNRGAFFEMFDDWANELKNFRPDLTEEDWESFKHNMYGSDNYLFNVDNEFVKGVETPLLILKGDDLYHPEDSSLRTHQLAQNSTLVEDWKSGVALEAAAQQFMEFIETHAS